MKHICISIIACLFALVSTGQDFVKNISTAKKSYAAGKLEDTHFALQQMLVELDLTIGKEVLKLLPAKMDTLSANPSDENVTANVGFIGATIHRSYGKGDKRGEISIITNSPMVASLNALFTSPLMNFANNGDNKVIKVQGYKGRLTKEANEGEKPSFRLEIPFNSSLITMNLNKTSESEIIALANTIPFSDIAKLIQ